MTPLKRRPRPREATDFTQITQKANSGTRFGPDWGAACSLDARVSGGPASPIQVSRGCLAVPGALCSQLVSQVHLPQTAGNFCPLSSLSASTTPCPPPWGSVLNQRERSPPHDQAPQDPDPHFVHLRAGGGARFGPAPKICLIMCLILFSSLNVKMADTFHIEPWFRASLQEMGRFDNEGSSVTGGSDKLE